MTNLLSVFICVHPRQFFYTNEKQKAQKIDIRHILSEYFPDYEILFTEQAFVFCGFLCLQFFVFGHSAFYDDCNGSRAFFACVTKNHFCHRLGHA